ncbi:hypothetical protein NDU88_006229 [Pleurodeles waltl]|uniref:Uncharacterized protein n=1 Tax=Pleurodeles waltl TaxID=8319 RepID=A0AAV7UKG3_PLEWA|nr:hypothetical protein NDU88_006229 [Pleurodeles waltl]
MVPTPDAVQADIRLSGEPAIEEGQTVQGQDEELGKIEENGKNTDWSKEEGYTFYSLTEASEAKSSGCTQMADNVSSDLETSLSSAIGPTVKQQPRQRRCIKERSGSLFGASAVGHSAATPKWDYSRISLCSQEKGPETLTPLKDIGEGSRWDYSTGNTEKTMLQLKYGTVKELQTETPTESRRARLVTKQLQVTVRKVAKTCGEIEEKLNALESRASTIEADIEILKDQAGTQEEYLTDIM